VPWKYFVDNPGDVWAMAEHLAGSIPQEGEKVVLEGREIEVETLVECWRWLFGQD